ncbi:adenosine deaminase family protein [Corynebacterium tapiri]|nr:adenosine deaminase family protein [Corynebacterium tapiri]
MHEAPLIDPAHKSATREVVASLPKVILHDTLTVDGARGQADVEVAARDHVARLAEDNVVYAELRFDPLLDALSLEDAIAAAERGVRSIDGIDARLILVAKQADEAIVDATITAHARGVVVGFAGPADAPTLQKLRRAFVPVTVDANTPLEIDEALELGATRIGHGTRVYEDFAVDENGVHPGPVSSWVRDRGIALEMTPSLDVASEEVEELSEHPITLLPEMGFTCTLNPADSMTDEFMSLVETADFGYDEIFGLTRTALENAFIPVPSRTALLAQTIIPAYQKLTALFNEDFES